MDFIPESQFCHYIFQCPEKSTCRLLLMGYLEQKFGYRVWQMSDFSFKWFNFVEMYFSYLILRRQGVYPYMYVDGYHAVDKAPGSQWRVLCCIHTSNWIAFEEAKEYWDTIVWCWSSYHDIGCHIYMLMLKRVYHYFIHVVWISL